MSSQARPPVVSYIVQHNITDNSSGLLEELTEWTNITIHGALPGHVYYIQVTPINILGPGAARTTRESTPVDNTHESIHLNHCGRSHISLGYCFVCATLLL